MMGFNAEQGVRRTVAGWPSMVSEFRVEELRSRFSAPLTVGDRQSSEPLETAGICIIGLFKRIVIIFTHEDKFIFLAG